MKTDWKTWKAVGQKLKKFRYPALILLLGIVLMRLPLGQKEPAAVEPAPTVSVQPDYKTQTEQQLKTVLEQVEGAGSVTVMLSMKSGAQTVYQVDTTTNSQTADDATTNAAQESTVILSRDDVGQEAAVVKTIYPLFLGAVVVCEGAENPTVALRVLQIVESVTGLRSERITIAKMK